MSLARARALLAAHGVDPAAGADALAAVVEAHGWGVKVEQHTVGGRAGRVPRWRALATPVEATGGGDRASLWTVSASGRSEAAALAVVLAKVLARAG